MAMKSYIFCGSFARAQDDKAKDAAQNWRANYTWAMDKTHG